MGARRWVWVAILAGAAGLTGPAAAASAGSLDSSLVGAWAASAGDCQRLFQRSGKGIVFRQPVDKFAQAAIIDPGQIRSTSSTCRIAKVTREKGSIRIDGECNDTISYTPQTLRIKVQGPGQITYSPSGDPALDTALVMCRL
jgi:hypothetical protein